MKIKHQWQTNIKSSPNSLAEPLTLRVAWRHQIFKCFQGLLQYQIIYMPNTPSPCFLHFFFHFSSLYHIDITVSRVINRITDSFLKFFHYFNQVWDVRWWIRPLTHVPQWIQRLTYTTKQIWTLVTSVGRDTTVDHWQKPFIIMKSWSMV